MTNRVILLLVLAYATLSAPAAAQESATITGRLSSVWPSDDAGPADPGRLSAATRRSAEAFWTNLSPRRAAALERRLLDVQARAEAGQDNATDWAFILHAHPQLRRISESMQQELRDPGDDGPAALVVIVVPLCKLEGDKLNCRVIMAPCPLCR
jgi:hypothetical protein